METTNFVNLPQNAAGETGIGVNITIDAQSAILLMSMVLITGIIIKKV